MKFVSEVEPPPPSAAMRAYLTSPAALAGRVMATKPAHVTAAASAPLAQFTGGGSQPNRRRHAMAPSLPEVNMTEAAGRTVAQCGPFTPLQRDRRVGTVARWGSARLQR